MYNFPGVYSMRIIEEQLTTAVLSQIALLNEVRRQGYYGAVTDWKLNVKQFQGLGLPVPPKPEAPMIFRVQIEVTGERAGLLKRDPVTIEYLPTLEGPNRFAEVI